MSETRFIIKAGELEALLESLIRLLQFLGGYARVTARWWAGLAFRSIRGHGRVSFPPHLGSSGAAIIGRRPKAD